MATAVENGGIRGANLTPNLFAWWNGDAASIRSVVAAIGHFDAAVSVAEPGSDRSILLSREDDASGSSNEITWDHPRLVELPGGQLCLGSIPFDGSVVDVQNGELISRAWYSDGMQEGVSRDYENGRCIREAWYRKGGLEGPTLTFDEAGGTTRTEYYSRGVCIAVHEFVNGEWLETERIEAASLNAKLSRMTWAD